LWPENKKQKTKKNNVNKISQFIRNKLRDFWECTIHSKLRTDLFAILANENSNFMQFSSEQKLIYLLNPTTTAHVKIIGFYIIKSLEQCSSSSILLQVLQTLSILGILQYRPFSISKLWSLILILVKPLLISELLYDIEI
jgi:hypothetical protein